MRAELAYLHAVIPVMLALVAIGGSDESSVLGDIDALVGDGDARDIWADVFALDGIELADGWVVGRLNCSGNGVVLGGGDHVGRGYAHAGEKGSNSNGNLHSVEYEWVEELKSRVSSVG